MSRLFVFGDSFAFGQGLTDAEADGVDNACPDYPHERSWPYTLGNLLGVDQTLNFSVPGCSNKMIWTYGVNVEYSPQDIVVFSWTNHQRTTALRSYMHKPLTVDENFTKDDHLQFYNNFDALGFGPWIDDEFNLSFYLKSDRYNHLDAWVESCLLFEHADAHARRFTRNVFHVCLPDNTQYFELMNKKTCEEEKKVCEQYEEMLWVADDNPEITPHWVRNQGMFTCSMNPEAITYPPALDGNHLGFEGNDAFAKRLFEKMSI
jgi:hypothetical protein